MSFYMKKILDVTMSVFLLLLVFYVSFFGIYVRANEEECQSNKIVVIDPGHGGIDPGKVGNNETLEKDINLQIARHLAEMLNHKGYTVFLTRTEDVGLYNESDVNKKAVDLKARCQFIEEKKADAVVSIHQNSFSDKSVRGGQVFYYKHSTRGCELATEIQNGFKSWVDDNNTRKPKSDESYYLLKKTKCPTVIVECGFLSNSEEEKLLSTEEYQNKICEAIAEGLDNFFQVEKE